MLGASWGLSMYLNSIAPDMDDSEYPREAFLELNKSIDRSGVVRISNPKNLDDSSLSDRFRLSQVSILDLAITQGKLYSIGEIGRKSNLTGFTVHVCEFLDFGPESSFNKCDEQRTSRKPISTVELITILKMELGDQGRLQTVYQNESKMEKLNAWFERIQYYDDKLEPKEFEWKPMEIILYEEKSGLHIIGQEIDNVSVDGREYEAESKGRWNYVDIELGPGRHSLETAGQKSELLVEGFRPRIIYHEGRLLIPGSNRSRMNHFYDHVEFDHSGERKILELEEELINLSMDTPPETIKATFISEKVNMTVQKTLVKNESYSSEVEMLAEVSGLTIDESRKIYGAIEYFDRVPFVNPMRKYKSGKGG